MITLPELRAIAVEAWETIETLPASSMPRVKTCWPEWEREDAGETFPVHLLPGAEQISRAERFFDAVNKLDTQAKRSAIYNWIKVKTSRNRTIRGYSEKMGFREHQYRTWIDTIFQEVAVHIRINSGAMVFEEVEQPQEISDKRSTSDEARASHWMADNAKPRASDEIQDRQNCLKAMLARSAERMGEAQRRQRVE